MSWSKALATGGGDARQHLFIKALVNGASPTAAATIAGYAFPSTDGNRLLRIPAIIEAIRGAMHSHLQTVSAPLALKTLESVVRNEKSGERIRVDAAKILLDRAGYAPKAQSDSDHAPKQLADMSAEELRSFIGQHEAEIAKVEGELAARATPVNAPNPTDPPLEPASFLD